MNGEVPPATTYEKWFNRQPIGTQRKIVGNKAFDERRKRSNGKIYWHEFALKKGSPARKAAIKTVKGPSPGTKP
jgi:hypothetical protein